MQRPDPIRLTDQGQLRAQLLARLELWRAARRPAGHVAAPVLVRPPPRPTPFLLHAVAGVGRPAPRAVLPDPSNPAHVWSVVVNDGGGSYRQPLWRLDDTDQALLQVAVLLVAQTAGGIDREPFIVAMREIAPPPDDLVPVRFVGWAPSDGGDLHGGDTTTARFLAGLASLARAARHERADGRVRVDMRLCASPEELLEQIAVPAYLTVVSAHGRDDSPILQDSTGTRQADLSELPGGGVRCSALALDVCYALARPLREALVRAVRPDTVLLGTPGAVPYHHGTLLMPMVLAALLCPTAPPHLTGNALRNLLAERVLKPAPSVWPGGLSRWEAVLAGSPPRPAPPAALTR